MRQSVGLLNLTLLLAGCTLPPHNNTLLFATKTDVGLGVTTPSATDAGLSVTVGFKERRAAWVPLWANKDRYGNAMDCAEIQAAAPAAGASSVAAQGPISCKHGPKFVGDGDAERGRSDMNDAYSTFASFGGDMAVNGANTPSAPAAGASAPTASTTFASTGTGTVSAKLATFFATGVAAQILSKNVASVGVPNKPEEQAKANKPEEPPKADAPRFKSVAEFITETRSGQLAAPKGTVQASCVTKLASKAKFDDAQNKSLSSISASAVSDWLILLESRKDLYAAQDRLEEAAKQLTTKLREHMTREDKSRLAATAVICKAEDA